MILDSFFQDVRVGLRVLFKDKTFCFLAVLVLGLASAVRRLNLQSSMQSCCVDFRFRIRSSW